MQNRFFFASSNASALKEMINQMELLKTQDMTRQNASTLIKHYWSAS